MDLLPPQYIQLLPCVSPIPQRALLAQALEPKVNPHTRSLVFGFSDSPQPLTLPQWQHFKRGAHNAITDVPGVQVGQLTVRQDTPAIIRTGLTAIVPDVAMLSQGQGNLANTGFKAAVVSLSGNGELTGSSFINEFGVLNAPILLTNTRSVGLVYEGVNRYFEKYFPGQWASQLPVVGECWDGFFNDAARTPVSPDAVETVIQQAKSGPVLQGRVGAGTGMRSFELHAGIGSSSRKITVGNQQYTIGVLVNMNHSRLADMVPQIRAQLEARFGPLENLKARDNRDTAHPVPVVVPRQGSIQVVIATDLPLSNQELEEMARRAGLGIGHTGSAMATTSGDFVTAFSTAHPIPMGKAVPAVISLSELHPDEMTPVFKATIEAVVEAQTNALVASHL